MVMLNDLDRFHLVIDVIDRVPGLGLDGGAPAPADGRRARLRAAPTRASTATIRPRSATGPGRTPSGCASSSSTPGSSSLKLSLLDGDEAVWSESLPSPGGRIDADAAADDDPARRPGRRRRPPHRPRRQRVRRRRCGSTTGVVRRLEALTDLAPLHQPKSLQALEAVQRRRCRTMPAVACFDTAFHARMPAGRVDLRPAARVAQALGPPPLRLPRALARLRVGAARRSSPGGRSRSCGSSPATSAPARRSPPSRAASRSTRRWASRRSRGS